MRYVVVIAGNRGQFDDYVKSAMFKKINYRDVSQSTVFEGVTFLYVHDQYQLRGYNFKGDAELVMIGTWYELSEETLQGIKESFFARKGN